MTNQDSWLHNFNLQIWCFFFIMTILRLFYLLQNLMQNRLLPIISLHLYTKWCNTFIINLITCVDKSVGKM